MHAFYAFLRGRSHYEWIEAQQQGRLLVCPTVWEDLAKTLLTTNTTWAQTKNMARRLCAFGDELAGFGRTFPTPAQIAPLDAPTLAAATGMGYRAPHLIALAQKITRGELEVEAWAARTLSADELFKQVKALKGFGDYAAGTLLKLLGYFDRLAIDTVARAGYKRLLSSATATDAEIQMYYADFGAWRGLVQWMDILRSDAMIESMQRAEGK
jgi:3-methyladenine DNA glycosylase/8-oxoguanine DNA glycosylase